LLSEYIWKEGNTRRKKREDEGKEKMKGRKGNY
jgi:hypothetical protein